jgi:hypothetical protein
MNEWRGGFAKTPAGDLLQARTIFAGNVVAAARSFRMALPRRTARKSVLHIGPTAARSAAESSTEE